VGKSAFWVIVIVVCTCGLSEAASPAGLDELIAEALRVNPEIQAAQKRYEALRQRVAQEGSLPEPMVSVGYASVGSPRPVAGLGSEPMARAGVMVSQELPFPGKRGLRSEIALKEAQEALQEYRAVALAVTARLKAAYQRWRHRRQQQRVLEISRDQFLAVIAISETRYAAGLAEQQDILKAQTQLAVLEARRIRLEQEARTATAEINSLLARPPDAPLALLEKTAPSELTASMKEILAAAFRDSPALRRAQKSIEKAGLGVDLARKNYLPDYTLSAGYYNQGKMPDMYEVRVDLKIPLWYWGKQRAAVAEQVNRASQTRREYEATAQELIFRLRESYLAAEASSRLVHMYADTVIPQAALALESSLASYQAGKADFLNVLTSLMAKTEYETNYYEEMLAFHLAVIRLEELTGTDWLKAERGGKR
jgi:cobalt-zinc-cadmium efflux system outer membrane protein